MYITVVFSLDLKLIERTTLHITFFYLYQQHITFCYCRYQLLPYWYTLFYVNEKEGIPPTRPMWSEFPKDVSGFSEEQQFMLGRLSHLIEAT